MEAKEIATRVESRGISQGIVPTGKEDARARLRAKREAKARSATSETSTGTSEMTTSDHAEGSSGAAGFKSSKSVLPAAPAETGMAPVDRPTKVTSSRVSSSTECSRIAAAAAGLERESRAVRCAGEVHG